MSKFQRVTVVAAGAAVPASIVAGPVWLATAWIGFCVAGLATAIRSAPLVDEGEMIASDGRPADDTVDRRLPSALIQAGKSVRLAAALPNAQHLGGTAATRSPGLAAVPTEPLPAWEPLTSASGATSGPVWPVVQDEHHEVPVLTTAVLRALGHLPHHMTDDVDAPGPSRWLEDEPRSSMATLLREAVRPTAPASLADCG